MQHEFYWVEFTTSHCWCSCPLLCCSVLFLSTQVCPSGLADRVLLGLIPCSAPSWLTACRALKSSTGGWLHVHGNVCTSVRQCDRVTSQMTCTSSGSSSTGVTTSDEDHCGRDLCCADGYECGSSEVNSAAKSFLTSDACGTQASAGGPSHKGSTAADSADHAHELVPEEQGDTQCMPCPYCRTMHCQLAKHTRTLHPPQSSNCVLCSLVHAKADSHLIWQSWAKAVSEQIQLHLKAVHSQHWHVECQHIEHVKSYAPHIDHMVADIRCLPPGWSSHLPITFLMHAHCIFWRIKFCQPTFPLLTPFWLTSWQNVYGMFKVAFLFIMIWCPLAAETTRTRILVLRPNLHYMGPEDWGVIFLQTMEQANQKYY